jgi:hypothetical protein
MPLMFGGCNKAVPQVTSNQVVTVRRGQGADYFLPLPPDAVDLARSHEVADVRLEEFVVVVELVVPL